MAVPTVRVYTWNQPAVSVGRLQKSEAVQALYPDLPIVRRPTGGRAVLHGSDLTITAAIPQECLPPDCRSVLASHQCIMDNVKSALEAIGINVCYGGCPIGTQKNVVNCFELAASCDLVDSHSGQKLVGSAQRREGDAFLQQMSLPSALISDRSIFLAKLRTGFDQTFMIY